MAKEEVIVLGFGGNAVDFFDTISSNYNIIGFVDDDINKHNLSYKGISVFPRSFLQSNPNSKIISLIGSEKTIHFRNKIIQDFNIPIERFATAIHADAIVSAGAIIGHDVVIMAGVVITSNAKIGNHIFILANTVIHHDVYIDDYTLIGSNVTIAGNVSIAKNCFIGSSSSIKNDVKIGGKCIIGMATNILKSITSNSIMVGNPAKKI
jgi:sugar O-acyltransferase (sialic acid O-acetyltransferase NeuD family)